jgi:hypothetical protein
VRGTTVGGIELCDDVPVGVERHGCRVTCVCGNFNDAAAFVDQQADEGVAQIVGARTFVGAIHCAPAALGLAVDLALDVAAEPRFEAGALEYASGPVLPVLGLPWCSAGTGKDQVVVGEWCQEAYRSRLAGLGVFEATVADRALDVDRLGSDVAPAQRERLARPKPSVGEHGDQRRIEQSLLVQQDVSQLLDGGWRHHRRKALIPVHGLADLAHGIVGDAVPLDGTLEHALQERQALLDRLRPGAVGGEVARELLDQLRICVKAAQRMPAETFVDVPIPHARV